MHDQRLLQLAITFCSILFLVSCATTLEPLPRESNLRIVIAPGAEFTEDFDYDGTVTENLAFGAGAGSTVGILAGFACGPAFLLCALGGGLVGGVAGGAAGGIYGVATAINNEEREQLTQIFDATFSTKTQSQYLEEYFNSNAKDRWKLDPVNADYTITIRFDQFSVIQQSSDKFVLGLVASLAITEDDLQPNNESTWYSYQHLTPERELSFFLDSENRSFESDFERGLDELTNQMVNSF